MILTDILGIDVLDSSGKRLGEVSDVRFALDAAPGPLLSKARLVGIIVSPRTASSFLGFERQNLTQPWPIAQLLRWRHRGSFLVLWEDIALMGPKSVRLRSDFTPYESGLTR
ncbi:PRC-barrel domain-containing protein [Paenarthrobacter ureafaciens]|uniref:PRC-barrel domain-containing protein n=1 Tax=Paenarthrobacter ureafaciens TaxID=37931 RepID=UPI0019178CB9|nr:PRC-barrel domain containing protein [Paenarthrobacter ureafaciens]QQQ61860.1 PRC-barrel domain containing protein [Paenarthrobacter ureafaciens]UOD80683.1 PRC-barrel domain containing protein [Paenarthrobacter ureafaciens]WNZ03340.1 PRC-barrel domain containing protein [Paenarthrobacter ureafaciens]